MQISKNNKNNLRNEKSVHASEVLERSKNYDCMLWTTKKNTSQVISEQNKCSIDNGKSSSICDKSPSAVCISNSVENAENLCDGKILDKYDTIQLALEKKQMKTKARDNNFTDFINNSCNLEDTEKFSNAVTYLKENRSYKRLPKTRYSYFQHVCSNNLASESILSTNFASEAYQQTLNMKMKRSQKWKNQLKSFSENDLVMQPLIPAFDFPAGININRNQKIKLLCVYSDGAYHEEASSEFHKILQDEDIKMLLSNMMWNISVGSNSLRIADENGQHITMIFRNALKVDFFYEHPNKLSLGKKFKSHSFMDVTGAVKGRNKSDQIRKLNSPFKNTVSANQPFLSGNKETARKSPKQAEERKINNDSILQEPILLNYIEQNKPKEVLIYKAHCVQNESKDNFCKTLEELLAKSVQCNNGLIHLVFEPRKLINRLKRKEKMKNLSVQNYYPCKHDLSRSPIYKKLLQYKSTLVLQNTVHKNEAFRAVLPKNEYTVQGTGREKSEGTITTNDGCLDLPKNFSASFMMKNIIMNRCTIHDSNTSETSTTPVIEMYSRLDIESATRPVILNHDCSDFAKNFCTQVARTNFVMDEQFGENKSKVNKIVKKVVNHRRNTTALKHVNVIKVVSSDFRYFFHFYSLLGGNLRSGAVISKSGSNHWLKEAGVATDSFTLKQATDLFTTFAGQKMVLNIFDYVKYLAAFAKNRRLIITELVQKMMVCEELSKPRFEKDKCKRCERMEEKENEPSEIYCEENRLRLSRSLPNIRIFSVSSNFENGDGRISQERA